MSLTTILQNLPPEMRPVMAELMDAMEQRFYDRYGAQREDLASLRSVVQELAEAQKRTEQRIEELAEAQKRTEQRVEELADAQKRTEQRLDRLEIVVTELAEAQKRTEKRLDRLEIVVTELAEAQKHTEQTLQALIVRADGISNRLDKVSNRLDRVSTRLDSVWGSQMEQRYRDRAYSYFGRVLRRVQAVSLQELETNLEVRLSADELDDLRLIDLVIQGRVKDHPDAPEVLLAIEVSAVIDAGDVQRALRRSALLQKAGYRAVPVVAGEDITEGAEAACRSAAVWVLQDGTQYNWKEALATLSR